MTQDLDERAFVTQTRLNRYPPIKLGYIMVMRLRTQGLRTTRLWLWDKIARQLYGFSPPEIAEVQPGLFVGGQHFRRGLQRMRALGVTAVLNLRREWDDAARGLALDAYLHLPVTDDDPPAVADFRRGAAFITEQRQQGRGVYIHCASGVGRAPTMAIAYLMLEQGLSLDAALATVRRVRPFIRITPPQLAALRALAAAFPAQPLQEGAMHPLLQQLCERLSEDEGITADLTDVAAMQVLRWAEAEIARWEAELGAQPDPQAWAEGRWTVLRRHLRRVAREAAAAADPQSAIAALLVSPTYQE